MKLKNTYIIALILTSLSALQPVAAHAQPSAPKNRISMEQARKAALKVFSGNVKGEELEYEGNRWVYSFDLKKDGDSNIHEVQIDAVTGQLVSQKTETAAQERDEAQEDAEKK
jgi:uncharacterized membrane protein YkoI